MVSFRQRLPFCYFLAKIAPATFETKKAKQLLIERTHELYPHSRVIKVILYSYSDQSAIIFLL